MSNPLVMSESEREQYLADTHVAVLSIAAAPGRPPLQSPVWYAYDAGGEVVINVGAGSRKAELLAEAGTASLCVQTEQLPYRFVVVSGPVTTGPADDATRRRIAERYLPAEMVDGYLAGSGDVADMMTVRLTPTTWRSNDFTKYTM
jgi:PPOX class probable F420-dependent enzyme